MADSQRRLNVRTAGGEARRRASFSPLPVGALTWGEGFWGDRHRLCRDRVLPAMRAAMRDRANGACLDCFALAAAGPTGERAQFTDWGDGDCYKYLEALVAMQGSDPDADRAREIGALIAAIGEAQEADGYLHTNIQREGADRWRRRNRHELYNFGHLFSAAALHHEVTCERTLLDIAVRAAAHLHGVFMPRPPELANFGWNPSQIMGLCDLHRVTGDGRWLDLARCFVDMRGSGELAGRDVWAGDSAADPDAGDQNQCRVPLRDEREAVGHAVTGVYLWTGASDVAAETGDAGLCEALVALWDDVVGRKIAVTGAVGVLHHGLSRRGDRVHEAFGAPFEQPQGTAYHETCANIAMAMWGWRLAVLTGKSRYLDMAETVLCNSALSAMDLSGERFRYTNPLHWRGAGQPLDSHDSHERWRTHDCYCCPPQVARTLARMQQWAYAVGEDAVYVQFFGASTVNLFDGEFVIEQATDYPWDGEVRLTVVSAPSRPIALNIRIPGWAKRARVAVDGQESPDVAPGTYFRVERVWQAGAGVSLVLPMEPVLLRADHRVESCRGKVAVRRGPVVYCLEQADLPEGVDIDDVWLLSDGPLRARREDRELGRVVAVHAEGAVCRKEPGLYAPLRRTEERIPLRLVPYYAWNNRGVGAMAVWFPLSCPGRGEI